MGPSSTEGDGCVSCPSQFWVCSLEMQEGKLVTCCAEYAWMEERRGGEDRGECYNANSWGMFMSLIVHMWLEPQHHAEVLWMTWREGTVVQSVYTSG